jgi:hypothetical protein
MDHYTVRVELEGNGTWSAWVDGVAIYAAADTREQAIRSAFEMLLEHDLKREDNRVADASGSVSDS